MARDGHTTAQDPLTYLLGRAWLYAGTPTYDEFEKLSVAVLGPGGRLTASTTNDIVNGKRKKPVRLKWVQDFRTVLREVAAGNGFDPDSLGSLEEWKEHCEAAWAQYYRSRRPATVPDTAVCAHSLGTIPECASETGSIPVQRTAGGTAGTAVRPDDTLGSIRQAIGVEWWHEYGDVVPAWAGAYMSLEPAARHIHCYETAVVPGLFQTDAYAGVVLRLVEDTRSETDLARLVELRRRRQEILTRPNAPTVWAVFEEKALRLDLVDPAILRGQVEHLLEVSQLPNVTVQVVSSAARSRSVLGYPITLLRFHVHQLPDVVYFEQLTTASYLCDPDDVSRYAQLLTALGGVALKPARTAGYLREILRDL